MKKIQLRKIVILLALSATPSVYASVLSLTPLGVANAVRLEISFNNSTVVTDMGFRSAPDQSCGNLVNASYTGGTPFALGQRRRGWPTSTGTCHGLPPIYALAPPALLPWTE